VSSENSNKLDILEERSRETRERLERIERLLLESSSRLSSSLRCTDESSSKPMDERDSCSGISTPPSLKLGAHYEDLPETTSKDMQDEYLAKRPDLTSHEIAVSSTEDGECTSNTTEELRELEEFSSKYVEMLGNMSETMFGIGEENSHNGNHPPLQRNQVSKGPDNGHAPFYSPYRSMSDWTYALYPKPVAEYIANLHRMSFIEEQLRLLEKAVPLGIQISENSKWHRTTFPFSHNYDDLRMATTYMKEELLSVQKYAKTARNACILDGIDLYELETLLEADYSEIGMNRQKRNPVTIKSELALHVEGCNRKRGEPPKDHNEFIHSWLLETLMASREYAELHRSFLSDPDVDEEIWRQLVSENWWLDETNTTEARSTMSYDVVLSCATRSAFTSGSAGVLISSQLKHSVTSMWAQAPKLHDQRKGNIYDDRKGNIYDLIPDRYRCPYCDVVLAETSSYAAHLEAHEEDLPHECTEAGCTKRFLEHYELMHHLEVHKALNINDLGQWTSFAKSSNIKKQNYAIAVTKLMELLYTYALYREQHRIAEEAHRKAGAQIFTPGLARQLKANEVAACAIKLLTYERVDTAWRKMHLLRWQLIQGHLLPRQWLTPQEVEEIELRQEAQRSRILHPLDEMTRVGYEGGLANVTFLKRKVSCPGRLQWSHGIDVYLSLQ
jgi:hypothetical protein